MENKVDITGLFKKLQAIMKEVDYIKKDATNTHNRYRYASERAIKEKLHNALVKHGVLFQVSTQNPQVVEGTLFIDVNYRFIDIDNGGALAGTFLGSGHNRDEKGHYAAITGAIKYILTSTFLIPTGDDPENDKNEQPVKGEKQVVAEAENQKIIDGQLPIDPTFSEEKLSEPDSKKKDALLKWVLGLENQGKIKQDSYELFTFEQLNKTMKEYKATLGK